ncbi:MAG TPA: YgiT-type zinc finger protein [Treponemataceae bacterium]|nr:YgiT-type zinc finger protein [Treponemataceae bacterium]
MTEEKLCPMCGQMATMQLVSLSQEAEIKGKLVKFASPALKCSSCGEEIFTPEQMDESLHASREAYERQYASPSPDELVALRERYGASQKAFSILLGFGELTMNSYEQGSIPDSTNRLLLKLAENPVCFAEMYRINKDKIGLTQRRRIESSEGFRSASSWVSLPGLTGDLTGVEMGKIETCAKATGVTITSKVTEYVRQSAFKDYSDLVTGAKWSGDATRLPIQSGPNSCMEDAS